ncbi:MAG: alpha/beta fold hydrolase [Myxococcota bacterium]
MRLAASCLLLLVLSFAVEEAALAAPGMKEVDFPTSDGLQAHADLYPSSKPSAPLVILFHQAGWSRGEYREIAPRLVALGYGVLAVDQRSGRGVNGVPNETHKRAHEKKLPTHYLDAYADLEAALRFAVEKLKARNIIVWGSSYSASLVFRLAAENREAVGAVLSFSPGEYFRKRGNTFIQGHARAVVVPLFVTSSKAERPQVKPIFDASPSERKILFTPASAGQHGSRALWARSPDNDVYWAAVKGFLKEYAPPPSK